MGVTHGIYPWDNALVRRSLDGETFWGRLWMDFLGGWGRGRGFLWYILYIEEWGFHFSMCQTIVNDPRSSMTWAACAVQSGQIDDLFHTLKTVKGLVHLVPPRTPRNCGYGVLCTYVYVT
jgi:hypothetical protein